MKEYRIPQYGITVRVEDKIGGKVGEIESRLKEQLIDPDPDQSNDSANAQADAIESFILALACEGYDVSEPRFVYALQSSLEAITNNS